MKRDLESNLYIVLTPNYSIHETFCICHDQVQTETPLSLIIQGLFRIVLGEPWDRRLLICMVVKVVLKKVCGKGNNKEVKEYFL